MCSFNVCCRVNVFEQRVQAKSLWPIWDFTCLSRSAFVRNLDSQNEQSNFLTPLWRCTCIRSWVFCLKPFPQRSQRWAFWFKCIAKWDLRTLVCAKRLWQYEHTYGLSPVCFLIWIFSDFFSVNLESHWVHAQGFVPEWDWICLLRFPWVVNFDEQRLHWNGRSPCAASDGSLSFLYWQTSPYSSHTGRA